MAETAGETGAAEGETDATDAVEIVTAEDTAATAGDEAGVVETAGETVAAEAAGDDTTGSGKPASEEPSNS